MVEAVAASNLHGTALVVGDRGLLIIGNSGSGKTTLALALVTQSLQAGRFARLVADDRSILSQRGGRLVCSAPPTIKGLAEVYGLGPRGIKTEQGAVIDLLVRLVPGADRFPEEEDEIVEGCALPCLRLAERNSAGAMLAVWAWLLRPPFG